MTTQLDSPFDYEEKPVQQQQKQRACLICRDAFVSSGPGERICKRCRSSSLWRNG